MRYKYRNTSDYMIQSLAEEVQWLLSMTVL